MLTQPHQTENTMRRKKPRTLVSKARALAATFGIRTAAGYLRNRGVNLDSALLILLGRVSR
jgi:hypothetical protein